MSAPGHIQYIETLSLKEQFRLVEIAHETTNHTIRNLAVELLGRYLASPIISMATRNVPVDDGAEMPK